MNKKQKTTILLVLVIGIWGLIGYNIYTHLSPEIPVFENQFRKKTSTKEATVFKNSFTISTYRDPFLGPLKKTKTPSKKPNKTTIQFPEIEYLGSMHGNHTTLYIISVLNQQEIVKIGQQFLGIRLISANKKQITISYKGVRKSIILNE